MKNMIKYLLAVFLLGSTSLFSQSLQKAQDDLLKRANENAALIKTEPEKSFQEAKKIEQEAQKINAKKAELRSIENQFIYYKRNNNFEKMITTAQSLSQKAENYKEPVFLLSGKIYLFEAYMFSGLDEKAFLQLEEGEKVLNKIHNEDVLSIVTKANFFLSKSNYYLLKTDYKNQLKYIKLAGKEFEKMPDGQYKQRSLYIYYGNLAGSYNNVNNLDSAKYYALLSLSKDNDYNLSDVTNGNLFVLGEIEIKKADYRKALLYFKESEKLEGYKNHLNIEYLYNNIILSYQKLEQEDSVKLYRAKKDSLKLSISENQNKSLHKLLDEKEGNAYGKYLYVLGFFLVVMMVLMFIVIQKNRLLVHQEKISQQYLETLSESQTKLNYSGLLEMLEEGDPAFMNYFDEAFPDFSKKLLEINPQIIQSEIEFCSLLKLKIPTKDIARYKYITPKTVQNKKYLIRKKLNIPKEVDIYQWFDVF